MKKTTRLIAFATLLTMLLPLASGAAAFADGGSLLKNGAAPLQADSNGIYKIEERLYEMTADKLDYDYALKAFANGEVQVGAAGCSAVRNCNYFGRNLDWFFDTGAEMVVHTKGGDGRIPTLGVVGAIPFLTPEAIADGSIRDKLPILPFCIVDGINENRVFMNVNVVPGADLGDRANTVVMPSDTVEETIDSAMLIRFVLDRFPSAEEAVDYLQKHVSVVLNENIKALGFETHYMLGDELHTYILEFIGNKLVAQCCDHGCGSKLDGRPIMTNFYLNLPEVSFNEDGTVRLNHDGKPNESGVTPHGAGLERYNLAVKEYEGTDAFFSMLKLMYDLQYSRAYNIYLEDFWYSEFVGDGVTNSNKLDDYPTVERLINKYRGRSRDAGVDSIWITTHTSIYDIGNRALYITVQEEMTGYRFDFR